MAKNTKVKAKSENNEISISHNEIDTPILDVHSLERLHHFRPDIVDFVIQETQKEANFRRKSKNKMNLFVFLERMLALFLGVFVASGGIFGSIYAALCGFEKLSWIIASTCIGSLAVAFLRKDKRK